MTEDASAAYAWLRASREDKVRRAVGAEVRRHKVRNLAELAERFPEAVKALREGLDDGT